MAGEKRATDHLEPSAKKRGNDRQLTKDDPSDDDEVRFYKIWLTFMQLVFLFPFPSFLET